MRLSKQFFTAALACALSLTMLTACNTTDSSRKPANSTASSASDTVSSVDETTDDSDDDNGDDVKIEEGPEITYEGSKTQGVVNKFNSGITKYYISYDIAGTLAGENVNYKCETATDGTKSYSKMGDEAVWYDEENDCMYIPQVGTDEKIVLKTTLNASSIPDTSGGIMIDPNIAYNYKQGKTTVGSITYDSETINATTTSNGSTITVKNTYCFDNTGNLACVISEYNGSRVIMKNIVMKTDFDTNILDPTKCGYEIKTIDDTGIVTETE